MYVSWSRSSSCPSVSEKSASRLALHFKIIGFIGSKEGANNICLQKSRMPIGRIHIFDVVFPVILMLEILESQPIKKASCLRKNTSKG